MPSGGEGGFDLVLLRFSLILNCLGLFRAREPVLGGARNEQEPQGKRAGAPRKTSRSPKENEQEGQLLRKCL
jgi:hypothetical protein